MRDNVKTVAMYHRVSFRAEQARTAERLVIIERTNVFFSNFAATTVNGDSATRLDDAPLRGLKAALTKIGMISFVASMCLTLPVAVLVPNVLFKLGLISRIQKEVMSLRVGEFCARWLLRLIPFARIDVTPSGEDVGDEPTVWVCNHTSMLDVFFLMAKDKRLRGRNKRPIKIVYWKQLEDNPVTGLLFKSCGFIPISMVANKPGEENEYDLASFKQFLKDSKKAFTEGFDIAILPEGQLNPNPEEGLLPVFPGAYTLARMSRRPIRMIAMHGAHTLWHPDDSKGMTVTGRTVKMRCFPGGFKFKDKEDFIKVFTELVGHFGRRGEDMPKDRLVELLNHGQQKSEEDPVLVVGN